MTIDTIRRFAEADKKKGGFNWTAGADPYPPVRRVCRDNDLISERKRIWRSDVKVLNVLFSCFDALNIELFSILHSVSEHE